MGIECGGSKHVQAGASLTSTDWLVIEVIEPPILHGGRLIDPLVLIHILKNKHISPVFNLILVVISCINKTNDRFPENRTTKLCQTHIISTCPFVFSTCVLYMGTRHLQRFWALKRGCVLYMGASYTWVFTVLTLENIA